MEPANETERETETATDNGSDRRAVRVKSSVSEIGAILDRPATRNLAIVVFGLACAFVLTRSGPLGWDESVYAARAKDLVTSDFSWGHRSGAYWSDLRAPGLPILTSAAFWIFGVSDFVARAVVAICAGLLLVVLGKTLDLYFSRRIGTTAVLLTALCPGFLATASLAFADIPAGLLGSLAVYQLARSHVDRDVRWLIGLPVTLAAVTTVRFGGIFLVVAPLVVIAVLVLVDIIREQAWRRLGSYAVAAVLSGGLVAALLGTRILTAKSSPVQATRDFHEALARPDGNWLQDLHAVLTPGPVDYGFTGSFWGWTYLVVFAFASVVAVSHLLIRRRWALAIALGSIAVAPVFFYSVTVNQFVTTYLAPIFVSSAVAVAVGFWGGRGRSLGGRTVEAKSPAAWRWLQHLGIPTIRVAVVSASAIVASVVMLTTLIGVVKMHERLKGFDEVREVSIVADQLLGPECKVLTSRTPQVAWYSDCYTARVSAGPASFDEAEGVTDELLREEARRVGAVSGDVIGFVLLDGLSTEPSIDQLWEQRVEAGSVVLSSSSGRRVGMIAVEVP